MDDYLGIEDVREACDQFVSEQSGQLMQIVIQDGHNGTILFSSENEC